MITLWREDRSFERGQKEVIYVKLKMIFVD